MLQAKEQHNALRSALNAIIAQPRGS